MIVSALISQCRREFRDIPKLSVASRDGDGSTAMFNIGKAPILESSYTVYLSGTSKTENTDYTIDLDSGDISMSAIPAANVPVKATFKSCFWRDKNWVEAINQSIESLNARGFFRQTVRQTWNISAGVQVYAGPSACVDVYEILQSDTSTVSGTYRKPFVNWQYDQDANKIVLGNKPTAASSMYRSYLRNLQTYSSTSATLDVLNDWIELVKKKAGAIYFRSQASQIALQGNATIDEGHFSFTNLRTMANDLDNAFEVEIKRKKPARPPKDLQFLMSDGGTP